MPGPSGVMDYRSPLKRLTVFLLASTSVVCLQGNPIEGVDHDLRCVTDYLYTITCSLTIAPSENRSDSNSSYRLTFMETYEKEKFECMLRNANGEYFCSAKKSQPEPGYYYGTFTDLDTFEISVCHNLTDGSENCDRLEDEYPPAENIKPNAPRRLTVSHNSGQHHFTWRNTYEEYAIFTDLVNGLTYQLHYYKKGDKPKVTSHAINTNSRNYSVDDENFVLDTEYAARVRSSPDQASYEGQWSDWSSEVHWKTESTVNDPPSNKYLLGLCVMVPLVLFFCYASVKKRRQSAFIPNPAHYFDTLYSDCQGDFKSWVVTHENMTEMLKAEETLQIDMLTKCAVVEEEECQTQFHQQFVEGSTYYNITDSGCEDSLLGIPYAVSSMAPRSSPEGSLQSLSLTSQTGSPAGGDSGCWLERDPPWYCNEYCTMSTFQPSRPVTAEDHGSPSTNSYPTGE